MISHGEIPGGCNRLQPLLYPFHRLYPRKILSKYRWFRNSRLQSLLPSLDKRKKWLTVIDRLGAPGDALITANVIRCIKEKYSNLKINCITPHPELIRLDPCIDSINDKESFYSFDSSYWELIVAAILVEERSREPLRIPFIKTLMKTNLISKIKCMISACFETNSIASVLYDARFKKRNLTLLM